MDDLLDVLRDQFDLHRHEERPRSQPMALAEGVELGSNVLRVLHRPAPYTIGRGEPVPSKCPAPYLGGAGLSEGVLMDHVGTLLAGHDRGRVGVAGHGRASHAGPHGR